MNPYRLYELNDHEFELLVVQLCIRKLGTGTFSFAPGKDGGRDGRFSGTAESYPSAKSPYAGKFVIQAKHTRSASASCSDAEFTRVLKDEAKRVKKLAARGEVEYYLIFTNRKLPGTRDERIRRQLASIPKLKDGHLIALETINSWLIDSPEIWRNLGFSRGELPFRVRPNDLVAVIRTFHNTIKDGFAQNKSATNFSHVDKKKKNRINKLSKEYFEYMQESSLPHFDRVKKFLEDPRNASLKDMYHDTADELRGKIIAHRNKFTTFDEVLTYLYEEIVDSMPDGQGRKRLVKVFLHYMYFDCDIGRHA